MQKFLYMLAPLEDTSDDALRTLCYRHGADTTFTEMASFESLALDNESTWEKLLIRNDTPAYVQNIGSKEDMLKKFLNKYQPPKAFLGFNLNLGCPNPAIISRGLGCAMVKRVSKTKKLVSIIQDYGYKCSIKMRLGLNRYEREKKVYCNLIDAIDAEFFVVHARDGSQLYGEPAEYSIYPECVSFGKPIIANGDITSDQIDSLRRIGVKGAMIGKNAVYDPAIFGRMKGIDHTTYEDLRREYEELSQQFPSRYKYKKNVLKRIGKMSSSDTEKAELSSLTMG